MKSFAALVVAVVALAACAPSDPADARVTRTIGDGAVTLRVPADCTPVDVQGIDSEVGRFVGDDLEIAYDFGVYSDPLTHPPDEADVETVDVAGRACRLITYDIVDEADWERVVAVHVPAIDEQGPGDQERKLTLRMRCRDAEAVAVARRIVGSIELH